jgi:hypothetical protein
MRGGGINVTTNRRMRAYRGASKSNDNGDGCMVAWYVCSVSKRKLARFGKQDILQGMTKWMSKNTFP